MAKKEQVQQIKKLYTPEFFDEVCENIKLIRINGPRWVPKVKITFKKRIKGISRCATVSGKVFKDDSLGIGVKLFDGQKIAAKMIIDHDIIEKIDVDVMDIYTFKRDTFDGLDKILEILKCH